MKNDSFLIFIFGSGAQGRVVKDILSAQYPSAILYFVDDNKELWNTNINDAIVISEEKMFKLDKAPKLHIAIGNPNMREILLKRFAQNNCSIISAVHPSAIIMPTAKVNNGCMVGAQVVINTDAAIEMCCIINTGAIVEHDTKIGQFSTVSPGAIIGGRVVIGNKSFVSSGAKIKARVNIGHCAIVGMGAVVTKDINDNEISFGVPATNKGIVDANYNWSKLF